MGLKIAATGFVSGQAGSVASANALLLRALLDRGCEMHFFSKASFVDPRPAAGSHEGFRFTDVDNRISDRIRARTERVPVVGPLARMLDVARYNQMVVRAIQREHSRAAFDVCVWFGDYARGRAPGLPTVSFAQGAPGTDARSVLRRFPEIVRVAGAAAAWKWRLLAMLRLSKAGLPRMKFSDLIIVGSSQSRKTLHGDFGIPESRTASVPYPIDLETFRPGPAAQAATRKRCLWLGRIIPRKRLDLFLDGLARALAGGADLEATIVGQVGFVPGYEKLIAAFPFPDRLAWIPSVPRGEVPGLLRAHDVLIQPSEEEDFGSSVAEAQACGIPVIVGRTNGNADYLCAADIPLRTDDPGELAGAIVEMTGRPRPSPEVSRAFAAQTFDKAAIAARFAELLVNVVRTRNGGAA
ncbi:MAG: glycosyltransferase family 4 protein [Verrucomicrobiae bacterium]